MIEDLVMEAEVGKTYLGTVTRLVDFGAFVEIFPGTEGLLHISEVADFRVEDINCELKLGRSDSGEGASASSRPTRSG